MSETPITAGGFTATQIEDTIANLERKRIIVRFGGGGSNDDAISNAITAATAASPSIWNHVELVWPTGEFPITQPFVIPDFVDSSGGLGCRLTYDGVLTGPVADVGSGSAGNLIQGEWPGIACTVEHQLNTIQLPGDDVWASTSYGAGPDYDNFCAYRFHGADRARFAVGTISNFPIGVQFALDRFFGYSEITLQAIFRCRVMVDVYGKKEAGSGGESGWFNENTIKLMHCASTSAHTGSAYALRFREDPTGSGGYNLHNADRVSGSIQMLDSEDSNDDWNVGTAYIAGNLIESFGNEYRALADITGGTQPTHTSGTVDNWQYVGPYRRRAIECVNAGQDIELEDVRLETGYGAPVGVVAGSNVNAGSNIVVKPSYVVLTDSANPSGGTYTDVECHDSQHNLEGITSQVQAIDGRPVDGDWTTVDFRRSILSNNNLWTTPGVSYFDRTTGALSATGHLGNGVLTIDGVYRSNSAVIPVFVCPVNSVCQQWELNRSETPDSTRFYAYALSATRSKLAHTTASPLIAGRKYTQTSDSINAILGSADSKNRAYVRAIDTSVAFVVVGVDAGVIGQLSVRPIHTSATKTDTTATLVPLNLYGNQTRYSDGIPVVGEFPRVGEIIEDVSGGSGWKVTSKGILAIAHAPGVTLQPGEYRTNAAKVYSHAGGTSPATAPTHTSGTVNGYTYVTSQIATIASL